MGVKKGVKNGGKHHWWEHHQQEPLPDQSMGPMAPPDSPNPLQAATEQQKQLDQQIAAEKKQLDSAPQVPVAAYQPSVDMLTEERVSHSMAEATVGIVGRCSWCGRVQSDLVLCETVGGVNRYKGIACCGGRHDGQQIRSSHGVTA
jgi:hypothetical protein